MAGHSEKHRPIYVRVAGYRKSKPSWYVIEEKEKLPMESSVNELIRCESETDRVRRLNLPEASLSTNNLAVLNTRVYMIGGDTYTQKHSDNESLGYRHIDLNSNMAVESWGSGGGKLIVSQLAGGVAVGHDGYVYSVGPTVHRFDPGMSTCVELPNMPKGSLYCPRLLGITKKNLYVYNEGAGVNYSNVMLSFDFKTNKWRDDDNEVLDDHFWGDWSSPGVVLYEDRYLFSFGSRSPKIKPKPQVPKSMTERVQVDDVREEEVPGIYVFDLKQCRWLPEPVQGLPRDGIVIPFPYQPLPEAPNTRRFSPQLFQTKKDDDHHLTLLWDSVNESNSDLTWCRFILDMHTNTSNDIPCFFAHSLSRGYCPLDKDTGHMLNCAVGM